MNKQRLEQLRKLHIEVESLAGGIISYVPKMVADSVTGCTPKRWDKHTITIQGLDMREYNELEKKLAAKTRKLMREIASLEDWIDGISEPMLRTAFRMRYGKGKTWECIGEAVGYDRTTIRDKCETYLKRGEQKKKVS